MKYTPKSRYNRLTQRHNEMSFFTFFQEIYEGYKEEKERQKKEKEYKKTEAKEQEIDEEIKKLNNNIFDYTFILNDLNINKRINEKTKIFIALSYKDKYKQRKKLENIENRGLIFLK